MTVGLAGAPALIVLVGFAVAFWPTLASFPPAWLANRVQGFGLAGLAIWMLWRGRHALVPGADTSSLVVPPLAVGSLVWAVGIILNAQILHQGILPILLFGWWYAVAGARAALAAVPALAIFLLATPFWGALVTPLQNVTVLANRVLLALSGLEAQIEGTYIAIPAGVFEVARGCSGANYFESGVVISTIYALFFLRTWRARGVAVLSGALLAAASNWIRVFGLIVIGQVTEMQSPLIKEHNVYGWVMFAVVFAGYFVLARVFERYDDRLVTAARADTVARQQIDAVGLTRRALAVASVALMLGPATVLAGTLGEPPAEADIPTEVPGLATNASWLAAPPPAAAWTPGFAGADVHKVRQLIVDGTVVQVDRFVYLTQAQGKEMIGGDSQLAPDSMRRGSGVVGPLDANGRMVNGSALLIGGKQWLAWQWYNVAGVNTHSTLEAKLLELVSWFFTRTPAEVVVMSATCGPEDCQAAQSALFRAATGRNPEAAR